MASSAAVVAALLASGACDSGWDAPSQESGGSAGATSGGTGGSGGTSGAGGAASGGSAGSSSGSGGTPSTGGAGGATGGSAGASSVGGFSSCEGALGPIEHTEPLRIMPLGDPITQSFCYRARLWQALTDAGKTATDFDFVGSHQTTGGCTPSTYDQDNEGHGGYLVTSLATATSGTQGTNAELVAWCAQNPADIVLMHFGTNDVWNNRPVQQILDAYGTVVDELRANNPSVVILLAQIIPLDPQDVVTCAGCACPACPTRTQALNAAIPAWACEKSTPESPIVVVDQWTDFNVDHAAGDTSDRVHPNASGSQKMADRWYAALAPLL